MEKISDQIESLYNKSELFKTMVILVKCFGKQFTNRGKSRETLANNLKKNNEETLGKWTEYVLNYKEDIHTIDYVLNKSFTIDDHKDEFMRIFIEINRCFEQVIMQTCNFIYDINDNNVKQYAPRSTICFWLFNNTEMLYCMSYISMFICGALSMEIIPNNIIRLEEILYRFNNIIAPVMKEYHLKLHEKMKERSPEIYNLCHKK